VGEGYRARFRTLYMPDGSQSKGGSSSYRSRPRTEPLAFSEAWMGWRSGSMTRDQSAPNVLCCIADSVCRWVGWMAAGYSNDASSALDTWTWRLLSECGSWLITSAVSTLPSKIGRDAGLDAMFSSLD
jgi:hypothetical protein